MPHAISKSAQDFAAPNFDIRQRFLSYYPCRQRTIFKNVSGKEWHTLNKKTALQDELILEAISGQAKYFRGLRWGDFTRFAVLDVDSGSAYHNVEGLELLKSALTAIGITQTRLYRSSHSGGWHIYLPFEIWESSDEVTGLLKSYFRLRGISTQSGQLEVFPSGNGLRLPLQFGFAWLNQDGTVECEREMLDSLEALGRFVHDIERAGNDWSYTKLRIKELLEGDPETLADTAVEDKHERLSTDGFEEFFQPKLIKENYEQGQKFWKEGLQKSGQRHKAVICVEHYLWHGDAAIGLPAYPGRFNDEERYRLILQWLNEKHNGFCNHINANNWRAVEDQIRRACIWRGEYIPERTPYVLTSERAIDRIVAQTKSSTRTWTPEDWRKGNEKRRAKARQKIEDAVNLCLSSGQQISRSTLEELTGCSPNTIKRHADLWKHLAIGSGDLEPGVCEDLGVVSAETDELAETEREENKIHPTASVRYTANENVISRELKDEGEVAVDPIVEATASEMFAGSSNGKVIDLDFWKEKSRSDGYRSDISTEDRFRTPELDAGRTSYQGGGKRGSRRRRAGNAGSVQLQIDFGWTVIEGRAPP